MPVARVLERHRAIAADSMVFIYHLQDHPRYAEATHSLFQAWERGSHFGITSVITLVEALVWPRRSGRPEVARDYLKLLTTYPNLRILEEDAFLAGLAADLRAQLGLRTPDAIQLAAAQRGGATAFMTNDRRLKAPDGLEVIQLDDLTEP